MVLRKRKETRGLYLSTFHAPDYIPIMNRKSNTTSSCRIARRADKQGARCTVKNQAGSVKYATGHLNTRAGLRIGTWNVRKLKLAGKLNTIINEMSRNYIQILGISETNWNDNGSFRSTDGCTVLFSGKDSGYSHGVVVILSRQIADALIGYSPISDRLLKLRLHAKPYNISIFQYYAPTSSATTEDIETFYEALKKQLITFQTVTLR